MKAKVRVMSDKRIMDGHEKKREIRAQRKGRSTLYGKDS